MLRENDDIKDLIYSFRKQEDPFKFIKEHEASLNSELAIPSKAHSYSMCIEYMKNWFESAFACDFFKSAYIDGKNIIDDFRGLTRQELIRRNRPCYTMKPSIDNDFNRDMLDHYPYGSNIFNNMCDLRTSFYQNFKSNTFIALESKIILMRFNFRIKVDTLAIAQDLLDFLQIKLRAGATMGREIDLDYHIPTSLMNQVACDNGFCVKDGKIQDTTAFLCHMNMNSRIPVMYKRRNSTGTLQYFLKMSDAYMHMRISEIRMDEGERQGHVMTNFGVDFDVEVRFPAPKFYAYHTFKDIKYIQGESDHDNNVIIIDDYPIAKIPKLNAKGWNQFISTDYLDDQENFDAKKPLSVCFSDLVGDIRKVIDYTMEIYISPSVFIDLKLFNMGNEVPIDIDWRNYTVNTKTAMMDRRSVLVFYVDTNYLNNHIINMKGEDKERINSFHESKVVRN